MNKLGWIGIALIVTSIALMGYYYYYLQPSAKPPTTIPTPTPTPYPTPTYPPYYPPPTPTYPPYYPTPTPTITPQVGQVIFKSSDGNTGSQIWVKYGSSVGIYIQLSGHASGMLKVEVRADYELWFDKDVATFTKFVNVDGSKKVYVGSFTAKDITGVDGFREYFVRVWFDGKLIYDPKDPNTRPWVKVYAPKGKIEYLGTLFQSDEGHT